MQPPRPTLCSAVLKKIFKVTLVSVILSMMVTAAILYAMGETGGMFLGLQLAIICPSLIMPPATYLFYRQALQLEAAHNELRDVHQRLFDVHLKLQSAHSDLEHKASHDQMTGLANRDFFLDRLSAMRRLSDHGYLMMIDADNFKRINDTYGHDAGDRALLAIGKAISQTVRTGDFGARIGGEEFAVILHGVDSADASVVAERIRACVEQTEIVTAEGETLKVTVSIGATAFGAHRHNDEIMRAADAMLYKAKNSGRNRVCVEPFMARAA
tara:strand:+ start:28761 stop:29570 length:810 start_codon:yes stop_codon:yes gene_type:complete